MIDKRRPWCNVADMAAKKRAGALPAEKASRKGHVAVRVDADVEARIEAVRVTLSTEWRPATQSDALRALLLAGLKALEKKT